MLHELSRQLKGELARDVAEELAMARDLAEELARREAELGQMPDRPSEDSQPGDGDGKGKGEGQRQGRGTAGGDPDRRRAARADWRRRPGRWSNGSRTRACAPRDRRPSGSGRSSSEGEATRVVERMERIGELCAGRQKPAAHREAQELSRTARACSPACSTCCTGTSSRPSSPGSSSSTAAIAELTARLKDLKTDADIDEWHRRAAELIRDLEKAGLTDAVAAAGRGDRRRGLERGRRDLGLGRRRRALRVAPVAYPDALVKVTVGSREDPGHDLKDMASARDEATPPEFKELVERYYEVLSKKEGPSEVLRPGQRCGE